MSSIKYLLTGATAVFVLAGAGCAPQSNVSTNASTDVFTNTPVDVILSEDANQPPVVTIEEAGNVHEGVRGSYCYGTGGTMICADTIGPVELIAGSEVEYTAVDDVRLTFKIAAPVREMNAEMLTDTGEPVCSMALAPVSPMEYIATLCNTIPSRYIVSVGVYYASGGDASYVFPIIIDPGRE